MLRGLAALLGGDALDVAEKFSAVLERAASKAPKKARAKAPPRPALELVAKAAEEPAAPAAPRIDAGVVEVEHRPAARGARAVEVVVRPVRRSR